MFLFEIEENSTIQNATLIAALELISGKAKRGKLNDWTVKKLSRYLRKFDLPFYTKEDFISMLKDKENPLQNVVANIEDGKIIWKGQKNTAKDKEQPVDDLRAKETVASMASKAMKK